MARTTLRLQIEHDLINDACRDLDLIAESLPRKHGAQYRALDRRIEALQDAHLSPVLHDLGEGRFMFAPPIQLADLIRDARTLGVI